MSAKLIKAKFASLIAILLLISVAIIPLINLASFNPASTDQAGQAVAAILQPPCHKNAQSTSTKSCSSFNLQLNIILPDALKTLLTQSEKSTFLFILGLLVLSPVQRIFKPPRLAFAHITL